MLIVRSFLVDCTDHDVSDGGMDSLLHKLLVVPKWLFFVQVCPLQRDHP
jgi:hypothetical protein